MQIISAPRWWTVVENDRRRMHCPSHPRGMRSPPRHAKRASIACLEQCGDNNNAKIMVTVRSSTVDTYRVAFCWLIKRPSLFIGSFIAAMGFNGYRRAWFNEFYIEEYWAVATVSLDAESTALHNQWRNIHI